MEAAARDAERNGWTLLSDSSGKGYIDRPWVRMEGYLTLAREIVDQMDVVPTHVFLQAGVGGLAASAAAYLRRAWGEAPRIVVVEPEVAPALFASVLAGAPKVSEGPVSDMGRLDCKEPSLIALKGLARDASDFMTITEEEGFAGAKACAVSGFPTTPSGAAGVAGLISAASAKADLGLEASSRVVVILSEEAEN